MNASLDREILAAAGWRSAEDGTPPSPYERFVGRLGFSLTRELLIDPPAGSVGLDLSLPDAGMEFELRRALYGLFREFFLSETCHVIRVNHGEWSFVPGDLRVTSHFEPFPVSVAPWAEYVVFGGGDFSHGVFCNPRNRHLVAFGGPFVARLAGLHGARLVAARVAASAG